jgi:putative OPT family oligopeptide transporter
MALGATTSKLIAAMSAEEIFRNYVRHIGIGGIAMAGIIGVIRSSKIIGGAFSLAFREIFQAKGKVVAETTRTQTDLRMAWIVLLILLTALLVFVFFLEGVVFDPVHAIVGLAIVLIVSFLFTTVAANAIAIVGTNPVSGMTLMTLILSSFVLTRVGLSGASGMVSGLIIGGVVCTALSVAGGFITDLKIGYWIGTTPKKQEAFKFLGVILSAATVGGVMYVLNETYGFTGDNALAAPQANAMAAVIQPLMSNVDAPWVLYLVGAVLSLLLYMIGISPLAFALGMYIPQELNTPLLAGGIVAWWVGSRSKDAALNLARTQRGTLIASGFIAGGSLFGVLSAFLRFGGVNLHIGEWAETYAAELVGLGAFILLFAYTVWDTMRAKAE